MEGNSRGNIHATIPRYTDITIQMAAVDRWKVSKGLGMRRMRDTAWHDVSSQLSILITIKAHT